MFKKLHKGKKRGAHWAINPLHKPTLRVKIDRYLQKNNKTWDEVCSKYGK